MPSPSVDSPASPGKSLLDRAKGLIRKGRLTAAPLLAAAAVSDTVAPVEAQAQMSLDYSTVTTYSNSGWLTGTSSDFELFIDDSGAGGTASGLSASLTGSRTISDGLFWRYSDSQDKTVPRSDTTGIAFVWGGQLLGSPAEDGDVFTVTANFTVNYDFTKSNQYDQPQLSFELQSGYGSSPYSIDYDYIQTPLYNSNENTSDSTWPDLADTSALAVAASMTDGVSFELTTQLNPSEGADVSYWFVQLNLNWNNEYANSWSWDDDYSKLNGDEFSALGTVNVVYDSVSVSAVPEPAETAAAFGAVALLALWARRRWHLRV